MEIFSPRHAKESVGKELTIFPHPIIKMYVNELGHVIVVGEFLYVFMGQWYRSLFPKGMHSMYMAKHSSFFYQSSGSSMKKIDYTTMTIVWEITIDDYHVIVSEVENDNLLVNNRDDKIIVIDQATGNQIFYSDITIDGFFGVMIRGWYWYSSNDGLFKRYPHCFSTTSEPIPVFDSYVHWGRNCVSRGGLFLFTFFNNIIRCYAVDTGQKRWSISNPCTTRKGVTDTLDRYLFLEHFHVDDFGNTNQITVIDVTTGNQVHSFSVSNKGYGKYACYGRLSRDRSRWIFFDDNALVRVELFPQQKNAMPSLFFKHKSTPLRRYLCSKMYVW